MEDAVHCAICEKDITQLGVDSRNSHVEQCLDSNASPSLSVCVADTALLSFAATETLTRLESCPVCSAEWMQFQCTRSAHIGQCAKRHQLSKDDLRSLIKLFREALDSSQSNPTASTSSKGSKVKNANTAFARAFSKPKKGTPTSTTTISKRTHSSSRPVVKQTSLDNCKNKKIDCSFGKQPSTDTENSETSDISVCRRFDGNRTASMEFEIESDEEFQSTKMRVPLCQTRISLTQRQSKRKREFLDELDDDLNEAKALSLSLVRTSEYGLDSADIPKNGGAKRRGVAGAKAEGALAVSEILASEEAQSYIRQRAAALAHMDECVRPGKRNDTHALSQADDSLCSASSNSLGLELWNLGSLSEPSGKEYCPIFEKFKADQQLV